VKRNKLPAVSASGMDVRDVFAARRQFVIDNFFVKSYSSGYIPL
jgi:hypothetical protein